MNISKNKEILQNYLSDESNSFWANLDEVSAVYYPESQDEVRQLIGELNKEKCLGTISGAGTSITGARVPMHGGVIISMERMLKVSSIMDYKKMEFSTLLGECSICINEGKQEAIIPPGISISVLAEILPKDYFYPPDPTEKSALIGATLATNASGGRSFYYGDTRQWIKGINLVLANGDMLEINRGEIFADSYDMFNFKSQGGQEYSFKRPLYDMPKIKNAAGLYTKKGMDLIDLFIGSEGILGVITKIKIKLFPKKGNFMGDISFFDCGKDALEYVDRLRAAKEKGVLSIEYFDENSLKFIREKYPEVKSNYKACVFTEIFEDEEAMRLLGEILDDSNVQDDWFADSENEIQKQKDFRHILPEGINSYLKQHQSYKLGTDFVVNIDQFPEMMRLYKETGEAYKSKFPRDGFHYVLFGHIGDCHLHFNFITHTKEEIDAAKEFYVQLAKRAINLGGTISGEHGVGKKMIKSNGNAIPYLQLMYGEFGINEIARIKKIFDSNKILNVGNMIPREKNM